MVGKNDNDVAVQRDSISQIPRAWKQTAKVVQVDKNSTYPSAYSCFRTLGTQVCHHRQSNESLAKMAPEIVWMSVESCEVTSFNLLPWTNTFCAPVQRAYQIKRCNLSSLHECITSLTGGMWGVSANKQTAVNCSPCELVWELLGCGGKEAGHGFLWT